MVDIMDNQDKILNDIIKEIIGEEEEFASINPEEVQEIIAEDTEDPQITSNEFEGLEFGENLNLEDMLNEMTGDPVEDEEAEDLRDFYDNIVYDIPEFTRKKIAMDLIGKVQADLDSRKGWEEAITSTLKTLGIAQNLDKDQISVMPFEDASTCEYPMLIRAAIQYVSRSVPEILPTNPAKAVIVGESNMEREEQVKRVEAAINYQLTFLDKGFYNDYRKGELFKSICGSIFRKAYYDKLIGQNITRLVKPQDFIIHYEQTDLESCERYTHRMHITNNDLHKRMYCGDYADVDVGMGQIQYERDSITKEIDKQDGFDIARANAEGEDLYHTIYEVHCNLNIEGFEDIGPDGEQTGIGLPYIITVHKESCKLLSVRRNWKPEDPRKQKQMWFVHYQFLPGTGFYGFGYAHLIGSLARASTALLRATLDGTALHLLKGGFKTADAKIDGDKCISPGEFRTLEGTYDDISKALFPLEFSAPSPQVIQIIQFMDKISQEVVANTEVMLGSASNTGPVGTTLALIEQGQKIYTSIHQATHRSFGEELRILGKLNFLYFPEQFEFTSEKGISFVYREDFDENVRIIPVSDPNIASFQQRQAIDQAVLQMATQFPQYFKMEEVIKRMMTNLHVPALDEIMYTPEELQQQAEKEAAAKQQAQEAAMQEQQMPVEVKMALQNQKIQGELERDRQKYEFEQANQNKETTDKKTLDLLKTILGS